MRITVGFAINIPIAPVSKPAIILDDSPVSLEFLPKLTKFLICNKKLKYYSNILLTF